MPTYVTLLKYTEQGIKSIKESPSRLEKAKQAYGRLLQETEEKSLHASSYYGLARIAILQKDP